MSQLGFDRCHSDPALFVSRVGKCFVFLWVDDLLIFSEQKLLQPQVDKILATFDGRDLKEFNHVLGMEVKRDKKAKTWSSSHWPPREVQEEVTALGIAPRLRQEPIRAVRVCGGGSIGGCQCGGIRCGGVS